MSALPHRIAAMIPAYQAAPTVADVVERVRRAIEHVVVVDDGSTDRTRAVLEPSGVEVLVHARNRGKGAALRTGMGALFARGFDYVATIDADGQHLPEQLPALIETLATRPDLVLGTRNHLFGSMSVLRRVSNRLSSRLISRFAGTDCPDIQTGFRVYGRRLFEEVGLPEDGFDAESAIVVRACRRGFAVVSTPVEMGRVDGRDSSHYRSIRDSARIARAVLGARFERSRR